MYLHHKNIETGDNFSVYFIQQDGKGNQPVKIGYSKDVEKRLLSLQTGNPNKLTIRVTVPCKTEAEAVHLERCLHRIASKKYRALSGEWFVLYGDWSKLLELAYKASTKMTEIPEMVKVKKKKKKEIVEILQLKSEILRLNRQIDLLLQEADMSL